MKMFEEININMNKTFELETQPITPENFKAVLQFNGYKIVGENNDYNPNTAKYQTYFMYDLLKGSISARCYPKHTGSPVVYVAAFNNEDYLDNPRLLTYDFDEFLAFVQKRIELKPLPIKTKFRPHWKIAKHGVHDWIEGKLYLDEIKTGYSMLYLLNGLEKMLGHGVLYYLPKQIPNEESNFGILSEDGSVYKAIWVGEE